MGFPAWIRVLAKNRFAISPSRLAAAFLITCFSLFNSCAALVQSLIFGRRIARTKLVDDPIFVLGHWRSGTTLLHELLVCDPRHSFVHTYACFCPNHFLVTGALTWFLGIFLPSRRPMDAMEIRWDSPQEEEWALCNMGLPSPYLTMLFPNRPPQDPEYLDLRGVPREDVQRWQQKFRWLLQCLAVRDSRRVVLKTPLHTSRITVLLELFPRAKFVHIVRNPSVIFPSTVHTWRQLYRWEGIQVPRYDGLEESVLATFERMYRAFEEEVSTIPPSQFCEVRYEDLTRDMPGQIRRIYEKLELKEFDQVLPRVQEYASKKSDYKKNRYEISPEMREQIHHRWRNYCEKYGYHE